MHRLGLPYVNAELTMPNEELATIEPCSDTLGTLHRIGEEGVMIVVASNLALPYSTPLRALWGILMPPSSLGAIRPDRALYAGLKALLGCDASELLMLFNMRRDDIYGAVEAGSRSAG